MLYVTQFASLNPILRTVCMDVGVNPLNDLPLGTLYNPRNKKYILAAYPMP